MPPQNLAGTRLLDPEPQLDVVPRRTRLVEVTMPVQENVLVQCPVILLMTAAASRTVFVLTETPRALQNKTK